MFTLGIVLIAIAVACLAAYLHDSKTIGSNETTPETDAFDKGIYAGAGLVSAFAGATALFIEAKLGMILVVIGALLLLGLGMVPFSDTDLDELPPFQQTLAKIGKWMSVTGTYLIVMGFLTLP